MIYGNVKKDNYKMIIKANDTDDFTQLSVVNGLNPRNGGSHINYILNKIIPPIREKLVRKYKTIKPADIKNKLKMKVVLRFVPALEFTSQEKIEISNANDVWDKVFENVKWDKIVRDLLKDEDLMLSITEYFSLKEKAKLNAELKKLDKKKPKKPKNEKFLAPVGPWDNILLAEGDCLEENTKILDENFQPKAIKEFKEGDFVISGDCTLQKITAFRKSLKKMNRIKTPSGEFLCSDEHRWYVYNKKTKEFEFLKTEIIKKDITNYSFVKSRINSKTTSLKIIKNENYILTCDSGNIKYTDNDFMIVYRDIDGDKNFIRVKATDIKQNDILVFG